MAHSDTRPPGFFVKARGAERACQSLRRANAAGVHDADRVVLLGVWALTIGRSKISDRFSLSQLATEIGRWKRPGPDDPRTDKQIATARKKVTEPIGKSLQRLHDAGCIIYEPGNGGRLSTVEFPPVDDEEEISHPVGDGVSEDPSEDLTPRRRGSHTPSAMVSHPVGDVLTPRQRRGTTDRSDRTDRVRSESRDNEPGRSPGSAQAPTDAGLEWWQDRYGLDEGSAEDARDLLELTSEQTELEHDPDDAVAAVRVLARVPSYWTDHVHDAYGKIRRGEATMARPWSIVEVIRGDLLADGRLDPADVDAVFPPKPPTPARKQPRKETR